MTQTLTHTLSFTAGLPDADGPYLFLMRNGSVVEGVLHRDFNRRVMTHYRLAVPYDPAPISHFADAGTDKIVGHAPIADHAWLDD